MERKIGEEFEYYGVRLKVVKYKASDGSCCGGCTLNISCGMRDKSITGECSASKRTDQTNVKFIKVKDMKEQEIKSLPIPEGWEFAGYENGEVKIRKVEPELPTDFEEALYTIKVSEIRSLLVPSGMYGAVSALCKLLIYRNAWWEKLGWRPDFKSTLLAKYIIENCGGRITTGISGVGYAVLAFPTEEVRDKFAETFKDLIEEAKELL